MKEDTTIRPAKLAIVVSHPIQHFVPFYRAIEQHPQILPHVFFGSRLGLRPYFDTEMNTTLSWNMDLLGGYTHSFLPKAEQVDSPGMFTLNDPGLAPALSAFRPDAVMIYGYNSMTALRALAWCRRRRVSALMISDSELRQDRGSVREFIRTLLLPRLLRRFDGFLTVGDENERYYRRYGVPGDRMFRSPFTIDEEAFRAAIARRDELRATVRAEAGIPADAFVTLFVGKLSDRKRPGDLLVAMRRLRDSRVNAIFAGSGPLIDELKAEARDLSNVTFFGFVNVDRLPSVYLAADVLVHPSSIDPHPLVCSEAAICGLPMILSDRIGAVGPTDVARVGENALVYRCGDVEELGRCLVLLAEDERLYRRMSRASKEIFSEVDIEASVTGLLSALRASGALPSRELR